MIKLDRISKSFGDLQIFADFSQEFAGNQITVILGPSGCGKSTLLNLLSGLVKPDQGKIYSTSQVSYLFQEPRLLPWLTIADNVALVIRDKLPLIQVKKEIVTYLEATGLLKYASFYPDQLSGGMRQRAALARAFCYPAPLLLMDEPFKSLDLKTRVNLIADFVTLWKIRPRTVVLTTHDIKEALLLGNDILVFSDKPVIIKKRIRIETPQELRRDDSNLTGLEHELYNLLLE